MAEESTTNHTKGWVRFALQLFERAGPITALILGVSAWIVITGQQRELTRLQDVNRQLFTKLEASDHAQLVMAQQCHRDAPEGR